MQASPGVDASSDLQGSRDIFFKCEQCGVPLVVDRAAAGLTLNCERCGKPTTVPSPEAAAAPAAKPLDRIAELQRRLKENEAQHTEITGYINQLNIQLHRWHLRLQTLEDRHKELGAEIARLAAAPGP